MLNGPTDALCYKILKHRKDMLLDLSNEFTRDVFNICIKYNLMHIWHGLEPPGGINRKINPLRYIKKVITTHNLSVDLKEGKTRECTFSKIYLINPFLYQKKYQLVEPFIQANCFSSPSGRKRFVKALLHPNSYLENCSLCGEQYRDICDHLITTCPRISDSRKKLRMKLTLYNYPNDDFPLSKEGVIKNALSSRVWRKCFTDFLTEVDY